MSDTVLENESESMPEIIELSDQEDGNIDVKTLAENKIIEANEYKKMLNSFDHEIEGIKKFENRIDSEIKFINKVSYGFRI